MLARLVSNSCPQVVCPPQPPKMWDYRYEPLRPASPGRFNVQYIFESPSLLLIYFMKEGGTSFISHKVI